MLETRLNILRILSEYEGAPLSSKDLVHLLALNGISMVERTVRYHLKILEEAGMLEHEGRSGRRITQKGMAEMERSRGAEIDFVRNHFNNCACMTDVDPASGRGTVSLTVCHLDRRLLPAALEALEALARTPYMIGSRVLVALEGQTVGAEEVPPGMAAIGVLSSASAVGVLIKEGIPAMPAYIGLMEVRAGAPERFSSIIGFQSISHDVLSIYLRGRQTDVGAAMSGAGNGRVVCMFLEVPAVCFHRVGKLAAEHEFVQALALGLPGMRLLDVPVGAAKAGVVIADSINAAAWLQERGIETSGDAYMATCEYARMTDVGEAAAAHAHGEGVSA